MNWRLFLFLLTSLSAFSQEKLSLQTCIDNVLSNQNHVIQQNTETAIAKINQKFHFWTLTPNLSLNTSLNTSFGRRVDPFTNTFTASQVNSQSFGLSSSMPLFSSFNYFHKKNVWNQTVQRNEILSEQKRNELIISSIDDFTELCKLEKQIELSKIRITHYEKIQSKQKILIQEGKIAFVDTLRSRNSILEEELKLNSFQSQLTNKTIQLNFKMSKSLLTTYNFELESIASLQTKPFFEEEYKLKLLETNQLIANYELKSTRSGYLPSISLSGNVGTGYSTNNKDFTVPDSPTKTYRNQINENLYEGIGLNINLPIFNRGEFFRTKQINDIRTNEFKLSKENTFNLKQLKITENEQKRINQLAEIAIIEEIVANLEVIFSKTNSLYLEGRTTFQDLSTSFVEWQSKIIELEFIKLEYLKSKIYY